MSYKLHFTCEDQEDITWHFGEANSSFHSAIADYPEQGVQASYYDAFDLAETGYGFTLFPCTSGNLISVWGGYGDTDAEKVRNAQFGISKLMDCVKNYFDKLSNAVGLTAYDPLGMVINEVYTYTKNGRKIRYTGSLMQVYDANDQLLGSSAIPAAGHYPRFINIPGTIPAAWTITDWRNNVNVGYLNPSFIRTGGGVEPYSNFLIVASVSKEENITQIMNYADWLYYLLHDDEEDVSPDEDTPEPEPGDDPYDGPYIPGEPDGGDGDGEDPYDPGDEPSIPDDPPVSIADTGLMTVYIPTNVQLNLLASYLWSNNFISSLVKDVYADPMDVLISLGIVPFNIPAGGSRNIKVGDRDSEVSSNYPSEKYHTIDCGSVRIGTTVGAYVDYAPYTKGEIYLPYVGMVPLDVDGLMGHTVGVKYKVDICTGSGLCFLTKDGYVWEQFSCNLMTPVPLSGANYSQMWQTVIGATATLAGAGMAAAPTLGGAAAAGEAAEGAQVASDMSAQGAKASSNIMSAAATKPTIQKTNNISILTAMLAMRKPVIYLSRPNLMLPKGQVKYTGYPSYVESKLSELTGYNRVSSINLTVPGATGAELKMIDAILKNGFIVGSGERPTGNGIVLGRLGSPTHQINKSVSQVATLTGVFRNDISILRPTVRIEYNSSTAFDYVYISDFSRWYYVDEITMVRKNIMDITLNVDPLTSFASGILNNTGIIDKSENKYNLYLNDDSLKMRQDPLYTIMEFPNGMFDNGAFEYVLLVAGS